MRVVYGMNPVRELLRARTEGVSELWLAEGQAEGQAEIPPVSAHPLS